MSETDDRTRLIRGEALTEAEREGLIVDCLRCANKRVFDRWSYIDYLEGRGWDIGQTDAVKEQIVIMESHLCCEGVDVRGNGRRDRDEELFVLCHDCLTSFDRRRAIGHRERAASEWPR